jgi:hypothetical protein
MATVYDDVFAESGYRLSFVTNLYGTPSQKNIAFSVAFRYNSMSLQQHED